MVDRYVWISAVLRVPAWRIGCGMCGGGIVDVAGVFIIIQVDYVVLAREIVVQVTPDMCLRHKRGRVYEP